MTSHVHSHKHGLLEFAVTGLYKSEWHVSGGKEQSEGSRCSSRRRDGHNMGDLLELPWHRL